MTGKPAGARPNRCGMKDTQKVTLVAFLAARLDEDEAAAKAADPGPWASAAPSLWVDAPGVGIIVQVRHFENAAHIARHDPARVLREVEAKRAIMAEHAEGYGSCQRCIGYRLTKAYPLEWPCPTVRSLAAVWSDHPGYRQEWKP